MKQLKIFLNILRNKGISCTCNFQIKHGEGYIEHYLLSSKPGFFLNVIFQTYGEHQGFTHYLENPNHDMTKASKEIFTNLDVL